MTSGTNAGRSGSSDSARVDVHGHGVLPWSHGSKVSGDLRLARLMSVRHLFHGAVLDLGCGMRPYQPLLGLECRRWIGLDLPMTCSGPSKAHTFGSALHIPFRSDSFDVVLCTEVLEHVTGPQALFNEAHRVLRPGGILVLTVPQTCGLHEEPHDYWRFTGHGLRLCSEQAGLDVTNVEQMGGAIATVGQMVIWHLNWIRRLPLGSIASRATNATLAWLALGLDRRLTTRYGGGAMSSTLEWLLVARKPDRPPA